MVSSRAEEVDQVSRSLKRIGDDGVGCECERCSQLPVDFGKEHRLHRRVRTVELGQPGELRLIGGGREPQYHAAIRPDGRASSRCLHI